MTGCDGEGGSDLSSDTLQLADQLLDVRTQFVGIIFRFSMKENPSKMSEIFSHIREIPQNSDAFIEFDWRVQHECALLTNNPIYVLMLNGFKTLYYRIGRYYFENNQARDKASEYYWQLSEVVKKSDEKALKSIIWNYGKESRKLWLTIRSTLKSLKQIP
jgi:GntR family negative regulator for fad regulon and positive regulator of fabA